ncbi:MAG: DUF4347 domain-containing protein [Cyanobacteria bacterium SBC]|nr:DUF4347 domain-containing protein [Cyanobacteria bacterium SBC]
MDGKRTLDPTHPRLFDLCRRFSTEVVMMLQPSPSTRVPRLVAVDAGVSDVDRLLSGLVPGAEAILLPLDRDGIVEISEALAQRPHVRELHVISHGSPGCLMLGNARLSLDTLDRSLDRLRSWSNAENGRTRPDFSLYLYGCQVAAGDAGAEFIEKLHRLTQAEIAASTTLTGCEALGGNWELNVRVGRSANGSFPFAQSIRQAYTGVLNNDDYTTTNPITEDEVLNIAAPGVLVNDGGGSALRNNSNPSTNGATVTVNADGSFTYDPRSVAAFQALPAYQAANPSTFTTDTFSYVNDGSLSSFTVTVEIRGVNDQPTASDTSLSTDEDTTLSGSLASLVADVDTGDTLTFTATTNLVSSRGATVTIDAAGNYTYDPTNATDLQALSLGQSIVDSFSYTVNDSQGATATGTVSITVSGLNDTLNALDDTAEVLTNQSVAINVLENDIDPDGDNFVIFSFDGFSANGGSISRSGSQLVYQAPGDFIGQDTFTYKITDSASNDTATVTVTINTPPIAEDDKVFTAAAGESLVIDLLANDSEPDARLGDTVGLQTFDATAKNGGSLSLITNNTGDTSDDKIRYTPPLGYNGPNRFSYTVEDQNGGTDTATVIINPADAIDDEARTKTNRSIEIDVLANDNLFSSVSISSFDTTALNNGTISQNGNLLVFTPADDFQGFDFFEYTVRDTDGNLDTARVQVLVADEVELPEPETPVAPNPNGNNGSITAIPPIASPSPNVTIDTVEGENPDTENVLFGNENNNALQGKAGRDVMSGLGGNDNLFGADNDDQLFGNAGNDFLQGELGNDLMFAGADNDFLDGGDGDDAMAGEVGDDTMQGGDGNDLIFGNAGFDRIDGGDGSDTVLGGRDNDILTGNLGDDIMAGDIGFDTVQGGDGNDLIFGNTDSDILDGSRGDDSLFGGQNDDILFGADGNDWLKGDLGGDILVGGNGNDRFIIVNDGSIDTINDFTTGDDKIDLSNTGFTAENIVLQPNGDDTWVAVVNTDTVLAIVKNVSFEQLGTEDFIFS